MGIENTVEYQSPVVGENEYDAIVWPKSIQGVYQFRELWLLVCVVFYLYMIPIRKIHRVCCRKRTLSTRTLWLRKNTVEVNITYLYCKYISRYGQVLFP